MKRQLRKLRLLEKVIPVSDMYNVSVTPDEIRFQGKYRPDIMLAMVRLFRTNIIDPNGYIIFKKNNIILVLT